jgi:4-amino-4-deoxy-L-arabinose transferase-like glycosyltransferase
MGVLATYGLGLLLMSRAVALLGALALLSIPNYFNMAREARPDAFLVAAILLSCLFLTLAVRSQVLIRKSGLFFVAGIFTGIGLVTKGPYGILFPLFFLFLAGLRKASWKSLGWPFGTYVIGALAASLAWAIPAYLQDHGIYLHRVLTQKALMTGVSGHYRPFYWYLGALAFTSLPLSLFVPLGIKKWREDGFSPMLAVALSILVVISFVPGKRNHYLLPMLPFFALGLADAIVRYAPAMPWVKRSAQILIPFAIVGLFSYFTIFLPLASPEGDIEYRLGKHASEILSPTDVLVCGRSIDEELAWVLGGIERVRSVENPKAAADMLLSLTNNTYWAGAPKELAELEKYVPESSLKKKYSVDEGKNKELVLYQFDRPSAIQSK